MSSMQGGNCTAHRQPQSNNSHTTSTSIRSAAASHHGKKLPRVTTHSRHVRGTGPKSHTSFEHSPFPSGQTPRKKGPNKMNNCDGFTCDIVKPGMIFSGLDPWRHLISDMQQRWHRNNSSFWHFRAIHQHWMIVVEAAAGHRQRCHSAGSTPQLETRPAEPSGQRTPQLGHTELRFLFSQSKFFPSCF